MAERSRRGAAARIQCRSPLDSVKQDEMLAVLIRNRKVLKEVLDSELLTQRHIEHISGGHALIWEVLTEFFERHRRAPAYGQMVSGIHQKLTDDPLRIRGPEYEEVDNFLAYAYDDKLHGCDLGKSKTHAADALESCRQFRQELIAREVHSSIVQGGRIALELPEILERAAKAFTHVSGAGKAIVPDLFPEGWDREAAAHLFKTEVTAFDNLVGGGPGAGEVIVFMAPYGSCKTVLTVQVACNWARQASRLVDSGGVEPGTRPVVFVISTEADDREFRIRALSYMANIPWQRVRQSLAPDRGVAWLSNSNKPGSSTDTRYEKAIFGSERCLSEQERISAAIKILRNHLVFLNCTDSNTERAFAGTKGVREIEVWTRAILDRSPGAYPIGFVLDHASAMAARAAMEIEGRTDSAAQRLILREIPLRCGEWLAKPYNVPCLVMHQLSGAANSKTAGAVAHHTDAAECKAFAEFADFAVVSSQPTEDADRLCVWRCSKHRREPPRDDAVISIAGEFAMIKDVSSQFVVVNGSAPRPVADVSMSDSLTQALKRQSARDTRAQIDQLFENEGLDV